MFKLRNRALQLTHVAKKARLQKAGFAIFNVLEASRRSLAHESMDCFQCLKIRLLPQDVIQRNVDSGRIISA